MNLDKIKEIAFKQMGNRKAHANREIGFLYYHGERVANLAIALRKMISDDSSHDDAMRIAAWFHDIAKGLESHSRYSAVLAEDILKDYCEPEVLAEIVEMIKYHPHRKKENTYPDYVKIIQDADVLDHCGTIEIWLNFNYYAHEGKGIGESLDFYKNDFKLHVAKMRELLNYEVSKRIFDDKTDFVLSFADRLSIEAAGGIYPFAALKGSKRIIPGVD